MSKGSKQRPPRVSQAKLAKNWQRTFEPQNRPVSDEDKKETQGDRDGA